MATQTPKEFEFSIGTWLTIRSSFRALVVFTVLAAQVLLAFAIAVEFTWLRLFGS